MVSLSGDHWFDSLYNLWAVLWSIFLLSSSKRYFLQTNTTGCNCWKTKVQLKDPNKQDRVKNKNREYDVTKAQNSYGLNLSRRRCVSRTEERRRKRNCPSENSASLRNSGDGTDLGISKEDRRVSFYQKNVRKLALIFIFKLDFILKSRYGVLYRFFFGNQLITTLKKSSALWVCLLVEYQLDDVSWCTLLKINQFIK